MKCLFLDIDGDGMGIDLALRAQEAGHDIRYWLPPQAHEPLPFGDGLFKKPDEWIPSMEWADLIVMIGNAKYASKLEPYFEEGYPIFGTNQKAAALELDREVGQQVLADHNIDTLPYTVVTSADEGIAHIAKTGQAYAMKPWGGDADKAMTHVGASPEDCIFTLNRWKEEGKFKGQLMLQEKVDGIEIGVSGWFGPHGWSSALEESFEHKKFLNDDLGCNTGEMGCYDAETEVLTSNGWKLWPDVTDADKLAVLSGDELIFEKPTEVVSYDYVGPMVCWENQTLDICVTPNHNMYVQRQHAAREGRNDYEFIQAENCTQAQYEIRRTADWKGSDTVTPEWARFIGIYIAEGHTSAKYQITIAQSHPVKANAVEKILAAAGLSYTRTANGFRLREATLLGKDLRQFGLSYEKTVPQCIADGSRAVIEAFLEGYCLGDGNIQPNGFRVFYTTSKYLADDIQELLLKISRIGVVKCRDRIGRVSAASDGHDIVSRRVSYEIIERVQKTYSWLDARDRSIRMYSGKVYCATVSSHVLYVRRNGKPLWCGNTVIRHVTRSKLFDQVLQPLTGYLSDCNFVGDCDVNCIVSGGKPWPLEFTMRLGWPDFCIRQEVHQCDPLEWMLDLVQGRDSLTVSTDIAVGVLMAHGDFPRSKDAPGTWTGYPIYGITPENQEHLHFQQVKWGKAMGFSDGKAKLEEGYLTAGDYVLIAGGTGKTVEAAIDAAYDTAWQIKWPSNVMMRTDIGKRLKDELPTLQKFGYATGMYYG